MPQELGTAVSRVNVAASNNQYDALEAPQLEQEEY
jgi:hypothetical protein